MTRCRRCTPLSLTLALLTTIAVSGGAAGATVEIRDDNGVRRVKADAYEADVAADGCLTNLRVGGQEFLKPGVSISRGCYFYQQGVGVVPIASVSQPAAGAIEASSDKAAVKYTFAADSVTFDVSNRSNVAMTWFVIFDPAVGAFRDDSTGELVKAPAQRSLKKSTWFRGNAKVTLTEGDGIWPWVENTQVWQAILKPGESRKIVLAAAQATDAEAKQAADVASGKVEVPPLAIYSPRNLQVFQRHSDEGGPGLLSGRLSVDAEKLEVHLSGNTQKGTPLPDEWHDVPIDPATKTFTVVAPLPAGGWYKLQARAKKGDQVVAEQTVEKFGVGEVFVIAGQSNSTNSGEQRITQSSGMVSSFSGRDWRIADDPQPGPHDNSTGGSPWPAFGDAMYKRYKVPIGIASTGHGGTSVNQWQPGGGLHNWMMGRIDQLGPRGFRAVLWHQGESDVAMPSDEYANKLTNIIAASNKAAGWAFPWFVAQVSYHNPDKPSFETTRSAQKKLWETGVAFEGPDTDTLGGDNRDAGGKGIHFSPKGLKAHGEMWAEKVSPHIDKALEQK